MRLLLLIGVRSRQYFNPRTPCGVRPRRGNIPSPHFLFQSTHPLRGATLPRLYVTLGRRHFNPRTPCGVRLYHPQPEPNRGHFNPRTPCGVRQVAEWHRRQSAKFQSTHPLRGATSGSHQLLCCPAYFNPRTPCGVRLAGHILSPRQVDISIHAPLAGCDLPCKLTFQPVQISIHAPLAGCDTHMTTTP